MKYYKLCLLLCILLAWPTYLSAGKKIKKTTAKQKSKKVLVVEEKKIMKPYVSFTGVAGTRVPRNCKKITSRNEWAKLWLQNEGLPIEQEEYDYFYNTSRVPVVDFDNCMVIAVFEFKGAVIRGIPFGGFTGMEAVEEKNNLVVHLNTKTFQTIDRSDSLKTAEPSNRSTLYAFFVIPRSSKKIILQMDARNADQRGNNVPPIWKEYTPIEP
jgi:hypothetical protein